MCLDSRSLLAFLSFATATLFVGQRVDAASGKVDLYLQNNQLDTDASRSLNNIAYYGVYTIGTPPRQFLGCYDTGSSDTWVPSNTCQSSVCKAHSQYNPNLSSTERNASRPSTYTIRYGTGTAQVILMYDTVSMAGINITDQGIGVATALSYDFASTSCDGLVGLGFAALSSTGALPPFLTAVKEEKLDQNLFALWLSPDPYVEPAGELTFGSTDSSKYTGTLRYINVTQELYWNVRMDKIEVGDTDVQAAASIAIIDSATTAIVLPTSDATRVHAQIPGAKYWPYVGAWNVSCDVTTLPNVTFTLGGLALTVPPRLYVQILTDSKGKSLGTCASAIVGGGQSIAGAGAAVLGTNFLRAWYAVHIVSSDLQKPQMGFAPSTSSGSTSTGGRRLQQNEHGLFSRPHHTLHQPRWSEESRRRLAERDAAVSPPETPRVFARTAENVGRHRWGKYASQEGQK